MPLLSCPSRRVHLPARTIQLPQPTVVWHSQLRLVRTPPTHRRDASADNVATCRATEPGPNSRASSSISWRVGAGARQLPRIAGSRRCAYTPPRDSAASPPWQTQRAGGTGQLLLMSACHAQRLAQGDASTRQQFDRDPLPQRLVARANKRRDRRLHPQRDPESCQGHQRQRHVARYPAPALPERTRLPLHRHLAHRSACSKSSRQRSAGGWPQMRDSEGLAQQRPPQAGAPSHAVGRHQAPLSVRASATACR
mmetsp:Transcript_11196/g.38956  ORF Transcript_11196/g.38956 Transcript_11196/m.38956 type:complete len:253 (+) Transcript_11196:1475-2233(+)